MNPHFGGDFLYAKKIGGTVNKKVKFGLRGGLARNEVMFSIFTCELGSWLVNKKSVSEIWHRLLT